MSAPISPPTIFRSFAFQPTMPESAERQRLRLLSQAPQFLQDPSTLQAAQTLGGQIIPDVLPELSKTAGIGGKLFSPGVALFDAFTTARREYNHHADTFTQQQRLMHAVQNTGDTVLFDTLAMILLPALLAKTIHKHVKKWLAHPSAPPLLVRHSRLTGLGATILVGLLTAKPIDKATDLFMKWTYRPLVWGGPPGTNQGPQPQAAAPSPPAIPPSRLAPR